MARVRTVADRREAPPKRREPAGERSPDGGQPDKSVPLIDSGQTKDPPDTCVDHFIKRQHGSPLFCTPGGRDSRPHTSLAPISSDVAWEVGHESWDTTEGQTREKREICRKLAKAHHHDELRLLQDSLSTFFTPTTGRRSRAPPKKFEDEDEKTATKQRPEEDMRMEVEMVGRGRMTLDKGLETAEHRYRLRGELVDPGR